MIAFLWLGFKGIWVVWLNIFHHIHLTTLLWCNEVIHTQLQIITAKFSKNNCISRSSHPSVHILHGQASDFLCSICGTDVLLYHWLWPLNRSAHRAMTSTGCNLFGCQIHRCYYCLYWHTHQHCLSYTFTLLTHSRNKMSATTDYNCYSNRIK